MKKRFQRPLVPQFILQKFKAGAFQGSLTAATLSMDMSGFTSLTASLFQHQHDGAEELSDVLAVVFQPMVEAVYAYNGFITHFAGDAFTAVYPIKDQSEQIAANDAWQTAVFLQQHLTENDQARSFKTRYGEFAFSVKVGLSFGEVHWKISGRDSKFAYYFYGAAIDGCAQAQNLAQDGQTIALNDFVKHQPALKKVRSLPGDVHYELKTGDPRQPQIQPIEPISQLDGLAYFISTAVLDLSLSADFRHVCPVFLSFKAQDDMTTLHNFVNEVLQLSDRYGGTFSRVELGDKGWFIALWFGAPLSYEDDVARAVKCLFALREKFPQEHSQVLQWRAGLTYGLVWAGIRGAACRGEYTLFGDVVNQAAHITMRANWGEIWLDDTAVAQLQTSYELTSLGNIQLKNSNHHQLYKAESAKVKVETPFLYPLVGRELEIKQILQAVHAIVDGCFAGLVTVYGEAGIGKSRLLAACQQPAVTLRWLNCEADGILRQQLNPFRMILEAEIGRLTGLTLQQKQEKFTRFLTTFIARLNKASDDRCVGLVAELQRTQSLLAALVGVFWQDSLYERLEPKLRFENTLIALTTFLQAVSLLNSSVLLIDNAHHLESASAQLINQLSRKLADFPIAVVLAGRFETANDVADLLGMTETDFTAVAVPAFKEPEITRLCQIISENKASTDTISFISQRSNGNPLYIEQMMLMFLEQGMLSLEKPLLTQVSLPQNINALLTARLDRLAAPVKQVVQNASVLGLRFLLPILENIAEDDETITGHVAFAQRAHVWARLDAIHYQFRNTNLRDVAYEMQPRAHRRLLHDRAAHSITNYFGVDSPSHFGEIAYHFEAACQQGLASARVFACQYLYRAGQEAAKNYETEAAIDYFSRALQLTAVAETKVRYDLLLAREQIYHWRGNRTKQIEDLELLGDLTAELGINEQGVVALRQAAYDMFLPDYAQALARSREAVLLAQKADNSILEAEGEYQIGRIYSWQRAYAEAATHFEKALQLISDSPVSTSLQAIDTESISEMFQLPKETIKIITDCLNGLGVTLDEQKHYAEAHHIYERALMIQREVQDYSGEVTTLMNLAWVSFMAHKTVMAESFYKQTLNICQRIGYRVGEGAARTNLAIVAFLHGNFTQADLFAERALHICTETGNVRGEAYLYSFLGLLYFYREDRDTAVAYSEKALAMGTEWEANNLLAKGNMCLGHLNRENKAWDKAAEAYERALTFRKKLNRVGQLVEPQTGLAQVAWLRGDLPLALAYCEAIYSQIEADELDGVWELFWVYQVCYLVLKEGGDERATAVKDKAVQALQAQVSSFNEAAAQTQYIKAFQARRLFWQLAQEP